MQGMRPAEPPRATAPLLRPGQTCWRIAHADRIAFLIDAASYFEAVRAALLAARRQVLLVAWDFDPRVELVRHRPLADGWPNTIESLLEAIVAARPELHVHVLRWQMPVPMGIRHPFKPLRLLDWQTDRRLQYRLDGHHPPGGCHHQKILVVDDALAFCGGMDFAGNRWDTPEHREDDPRRVQPLGGHYEPRHDVMAMVDGDVARCLGELARERWRGATGESLPAPAAEGGAPWPGHVAADECHIAVGLARTDPKWPNGAPVREIEALYLDAVAAARRHIYIESQYFAWRRIADALARRLGERDGPEVVIVLPRESPSWIEHQLMDAPRAFLVERLRRADRHRRLRVCQPVGSSGQPITIHSKVMIVDDRFLRVGSANLNNRSMGFDTECDLAVEASGPGERDTVQTFLGRLLAEHLGLDPAIVRERLSRHGLVRLVDEAARRGGRHLAPLEPEESSLPEHLIAGFRLLDPKGPHENFAPWRRRPSPRVRRALARSLGTAAVAVGAVAAGTLVVTGLQRARGGASRVR